MNLWSFYEWINIKQYYKILWTFKFQILPAKRGSDFSAVKWAISLGFSQKKKKFSDLINVQRVGNQLDRLDFGGAALGAKIAPHQSVSGQSFQVVIVVQKCVHVNLKNWCKFNWIIKKVGLKKSFEHVFFWNF